METLCIFIPLGMQQPRIYIIWIKLHKSWFYGLVSGHEQSFGSQKRKTTNDARVIFLPYVQTPFMGRSFLILARRLTSPAYYHRRQILYQSVPGFRAVTPRNLRIFKGMASGSYNSVSTAMLHCDVVNISSTWQTYSPMAWRLCIFSGSRGCFEAAKHDCRWRTECEPHLQVLRSSNSTSYMA